MRPETPHVELHSSFYRHIVIKRETQNEVIATEPGRKFLKWIGFVDCRLWRSVQSGIARDAHNMTIEYVTFLPDYKIDNRPAPFAKLRSRGNQAVAAHAVEH